VLNELQSLGVLLEKLDFAAMTQDEIEDVCDSKFCLFIFKYCLSVSYT